MIVLLFFFFFTPLGIEPRTNKLKRGWGKEMYVRIPSSGNIFFESDTLPPPRPPILARLAVEQAGPQQAVMAKTSSTAMERILPGLSPGLPSTPLPRCPAARELRNSGALFIFLLLLLKSFIISRGKIWAIREISGNLKS